MIPDENALLRSIHNSTSHSLRFIRCRQHGFLRMQALNCSSMKVSSDPSMPYKVPIATSYPQPARSPLKIKLQAQQPLCGTAKVLAPSKNIAPPRRCRNCPEATGTCRSQLQTHCWNKEMQDTNADGHIKSQLPTLSIFHFPLVSHSIGLSNRVCHIFPATA